MNRTEVENGLVKCEDMSRNATIDDVICLAG